MEPPMSKHQTKNSTFQSPRTPHLLPPQCETPHHTHPCHWCPPTVQSQLFRLFLQRKRQVSLQDSVELVTDANKQHLGGRFTPAGSKTTAARNGPSPTERGRWSLDALSKDGRTSCRIRWSPLVSMFGDLVLRSPSGVLRLW